MRDEFWHQIVCKALGGKPNQISLDFHSGFNQPAISRYGATTPELLKWFSSYNKGKPYRDQVKPFGFMFAMTAKPNSGRSQYHRGGSGSTLTRQSDLRPIAPFDKHNAKVISRCFDQLIGKPISGDALKTYGKALSRYHLQPESKFQNGDYWDAGATARRHVQAGHVVQIGKETNDWERQAILGVNPDSNIAYGVSAHELSEDLRKFVSEHGRATAVRLIGVPARRLKALECCNQGAGLKRLAVKVGARLPKARELAVKSKSGRRGEFERLKKRVEQNGLREAARHFGMDPSNLRRRLIRLAWAP